MKSFFGLAQNILEVSKPIWTRPKQFGPKEGQGKISYCFKRNHLTKRIFKLHAEAQKCHFGIFLDRAGMAVPFQYRPSKVPRRIFKNIFAFGSHESLASMEFLFSLTYLTVFKGIICFSLYIINHMILYIMIVIMTSDFSVKSSWEGH